jgi:energy-coupling factor transporter ATP-binding protein EcfA2
MTNNDVFKKLRVALKFRDDDIVSILELVDFKISKSELGAFFRKEDHPNYMECGDQVLRNFLNGLVIHLRGTKENPKNPGEVLLGQDNVEKKQVKVQRTEKTKDNDRSFKAKQLKKVDRALPNIKYKNKKKS